MLEGALVYGGALLAWALALYVASRGGWQRVPTASAAAMLALVVYLVGLAIATLTADYPTWLAWLRWTWPGAALAPGLWLVAAVALVVAEAPGPMASCWQRAWPWLARGTLAAAAFFAVVGALTGLLHDWSGAPTIQPLGPAHWRAPAGPLYPLYQLYVLACVLVAAYGLARLWRTSGPGTPLRERFGWLLVSALLFGLGGAQLSFAELQPNDSTLPGELMLVVGMVAMGWNVARYGALLSGEVVAGDLIGFGLRQLVVVVAYGALLLLLGPAEHGWLARALSLLPLLMATHALMAARLRPLDRLLYGPVVAAARDALAGLAVAVGRQPDATSALVEVRERVDTLLRSAEAGASASADPTSKPPTARDADRAGPPLRLLVESALRHLNDAPTLSSHPLLDRLGRDDDATTPLERAARLRACLVEAIDRLHPPGPRPPPGASAGTGPWLHHLVLYEAYVEGRPNKQVMQRYHLSEGTFHRARRRAIDAIAADLAARHQ